MVPIQILSLILFHLINIFSTMTIHYKNPVQLRPKFRDRKKNRSPIKFRDRIQRPICLESKYIQFGDRTLPCGLYWRSKNNSVSDIGDRKNIWSQLETKIFVGLKILRPTQILVSNLNLVETKILFGLRFRDRIASPVSIRDQADFGLQGGFNIPEGSGQFRDRKIYWSQNKIRDQLFRFQNAICSETELWIRSPFETNCMFGLQPQNYLQFLGF